MAGQDGKLRILTIEDDPGDVVLLRRHLESEPLWELLHADRLGTGLELLRTQAVDLILLDLLLPDATGLDTLNRVLDHTQRMPIVVLTGRQEQALALDAVRHGAQDYLVKSELSTPLLTRSILYAIERFRFQEEREAVDQKMKAARDIQRHFLPREAPPLMGIEIGGCTMTAEATGGDFFDYFPMGDRFWGLVVGDVSGRGFAPALLATACRSYLRALSHIQTFLPSMLSAVNQLLFEDTVEGQFVTSIILKLDPVNRSFVYSSAGHPEGFVLSKTGEVKQRLAATGLPFGVLPGQRFTTGAPVDLECGDILFLLSDGVREAMSSSGELFGVDRAIGTLHANVDHCARHIAEQVCQAALQFAQQQRDDITAVIVKVADA